MTVIALGSVVLSLAETAALTPSYEVPHPALSTAAISQGKGVHAVCTKWTAACFMCRSKSQIPAMTL